MFRSDLCDYSDAYVWVKGTITVTNPNNNANFDRRLTLKNNAPFISCVSKINGELVENAEDLDIVIPMYNLLEYSKKIVFLEVHQQLLQIVLILQQVQNLK